MELNIAIDLWKPQMLCLNFTTGKNAAAAISIEAILLSIDPVVNWYVVACERECVWLLLFSQRGYFATTSRPTIAYDYFNIRL